ncbi:DMBT1 protein, partial [Asarcornis scutulata]|nr:DMBT1 protein [Asarcornis scutulata]
RCAGRVEVKHQDRWGTVCDDSWDMSNTAVVCRQLGCGVALKAHQYAHFGPGSGPIWLNIVHCNGKESALSNCTYRRREVSSCYHSEDAGVTCSGTLSLWPLLQLLWEQEHKCGLSHPPFSPEYTGFRLVNGSTACEGRVEVEVLGMWGTLCASRWDLSDAHVLCQHLGCG